MKMQKLTLLIFLFGSLQFAKAQISFMPKAGVSFTDVNLSEALKTQFYGTPLGSSFKVKGRLGFMGGLAVNVQMSDLISIQPELMYIQKGFMADSTNFSDNVRIEYLELPILLKFSVGDDTKRGYFNLGPQVGIGLGGQRVVKVTNQEGEEFTSLASVRFKKQPTNYEGGNYFFENKLDFGIQAGGGFGFKLGNGFLTIDFRYSLGFGNLVKFEENPDLNLTKADVKSKNRMFATNIAYFIPLGGGKSETVDEEGDE